MSAALNYQKIPAGDPLPSSGTDASSSSPATRSAHFDVCPTWLELATRHLSDARAAQLERVAEWNRAEGVPEAGALEWEFEMSMQAMVACGNAIHAFSGAVQSRIQLPQFVCEEWRRNDTPRYMQVAEVFRRAFSLSSKNVSGVRQCVGEILRFHELAIDPSQKSDATVFHPELRVAIEWRFVYFRYENAALITQATLRLISELVTSGTANEIEVQTYVDALRPKIDELRKSSALKSPHS